MKSYLITYAKWLVWQYYQTEWNRKLAIWLGGAPWLPASPDQEANLLQSAWFDLIRPEYYGYSRSVGYFSTKNCIQTVYDTIHTFRQQLPLISVYSPDELVAPLYDEIVLIWWSYGGWIAAAMPKFEPLIKEIVLLYPALTRMERGHINHPEESDEDFLRQYLLGYKPIYRFEERTDPYNGLLDIEWLFSLEDIGHLYDKKVFIWHGSSDDVIRCWRSQSFYNQLKDINPDGKYHYAEYYGLWHGGICKQAALKWRLHRRQQFEQ